MELPLVLTREQVRRVDEIAVNRYGMSSLVLMENAGRGVVDELLAFDPSLVASSSSPRKLVAILCGKGNNGGDGLVIARHLTIHGVRTVVVLLGDGDDLTGDALSNWRTLRFCGDTIVEIHSPEPLDVREFLDLDASGAAWIVDAMLGTGATGAPRAPFDAAIEWMNRQGARRLAVDVPSGLDCDTGVPASNTVRADLTCTFVAMKPGFFQESAKAYLGEVRVVSIGVPPRLVRDAAGV
jgi:NAD(P)H-hydrate epimerase